MENPSQSIFRVAVEAPFFKALNYIVPPELQGQAKIGQKVFVPLGKREASGVLLGPATESTDRELKAIARLDPEHSPIPESYLQWLTWISDYYFFPLGATLGLAFPPLKKAAEGKSKSSKRSLFQNPTLQEPDRVLTPEQLATLQKIRPFVIEGGFSVHLIFGVTGSGKTEIYLQLLQDVLKQGRRGLLLVPEISLTPQLIDRFAGRFGDQVAVLHSQLTERERTNFWWDIREGKKSILLGARSAQFCPIDNLGLIVVDEEHEVRPVRLHYSGIPVGLPHSVKRGGPHTGPAGVRVIATRDVRDCLRETTTLKCGVLLVEGQGVVNGVSPVGEEGGHVVIKGSLLASQGRVACPPKPFITLRAV